MKQIFYKGDEVKHPNYGDGVVKEVVDGPYPVEVRFDSGDSIAFPHDGGERLTFPDGTQFSYGTPPPRKWIPTEACWAWVWGGEEMPDRPPTAYLVNFVDGQYVDVVGSTWKYAEPCDPPKWEGDKE